MSTATLTVNDLQVKNTVMRQLDWDAQVDASAIGVAVKDGAVTLTGYVGSYAGKLAAERAAKRVHGVRAVANDVLVRLALERTDPDIAADVVAALRLHSNIPESVQAAVHNGHVTLTGDVTWLFQKRDAERALRNITGVHDIRNHIFVSGRVAERDVRRRIVAALHRNADVDAGHIRVAVSGETTTLTGTVRSWLQRQSAELAAADAPGINRVDNQIVVEPAYPAIQAVPDEEC